jgi:uncharacterized membrane protein YfcA
MEHALTVFLAGFAAGTMNALAGGGSFVSLPALIGAGVPSVNANASSTVALLPGGLASTWAYRDGLGSVGTASLRALLLITLIGGLLGALLLLYTPSRVFDFALPWLLLIATLTLAFGRSIGERLRKHPGGVRPNTVLAVQFVLGVYGGYFGGAVGIMMMAAWGLIESRDLKTLNAPRTLLVTAANSTAVITFVIAKAVYWQQTLIMLVGATAGGYGGALLGRRIPARVTRAGTLALTSAITVAFFFKAYGGGS